MAENVEQDTSNKLMTPLGDITFVIVVNKTPGVVQPLIHKSSHSPTY
jgi:hypothetical protein